MLKSAVVTIFLACTLILVVANNNQNFKAEVFAANTTSKCNATNTTYEWKYSNIYEILPLRAVFGGYDAKQNAIYVGRAYHAGTFWPASIVPALRTAYMTYNGKTYTKETYEVLTGTNFTWEMGYDGRVPNGAINTTTGIWIGRAVYKNAQIVGKVSEKAKTCQFSYDNKEKENNKYEVLIHHGPYICTCKW